MGLENDGKPEIAQQDADAGSFQAEATELLHAGQPQPAQEHDSTVTSSSPKPGNSADHLESGLMPGLNTDHFHTAARELLFQHNSRGVPVAFQPHNDVAAAGLPQINIFNSSNQTELHTDVKNNLAPYDNKTVPLHDALPAPTDGNQPSPQNGETQVENYVVKKGDSLWKIARENLPKGASNRIVANYVHQIEADNPMHDPNLIMPGQIIKVRGYAPAIEHDTIHGAEHHGAPEHYHNNRHHEHYHTIDHHTENANANPAEENEPLPVVPSPSQSDKPAPIKDVAPPPTPNNDKIENLPPVEQHPAQDAAVIQERQKLTELAQQKMGERSQEYKKLRADMSHFEDRAHTQMETTYRKPGMTAQDAATKAAKEIAGTYKDAAALLSTDRTDKLTGTELKHLASEEIHQAAYSTHIDEGQHETCQTDVVEEYAYTLAPAEATKLVTETALTGKYTASDGTIVKIDPTPHDEARHYPVRPGQRSHASQIFQETAINLAWAKKDPSGETKFVWVPPSMRSKLAGEELLRNGKRVTHSGNLAIESGAPAMVPQDLTMVSNLITGRHDKSIVVASPTSPQDLQVKVQELEQHGRLPAVFYVFTGQGQTKPFSNAEPGVHTVLLGGYISAHNGEPGKIIVDNSWGGAWDRKYGVMDVNTLYQATQNQRGTKDNVREKRP